MHLKLQQIGNSVGVIIPKEELVNRNLSVGDIIEIEIEDDPFWQSIEQYSVEQRRSVDELENISDDDMSEWGDI